MCKLECVCVCVCWYPDVCVRALVRVWQQLRINPCSCVRVFAHTRAHKHTHTHTHACTRTHTHTHTHDYIEHWCVATSAQYSVAVCCIALQCVSMCCSALQSFAAYEVALTSRLLQIIGLFCKRALLKRLHSTKETYDFRELTNRSHPIWHVPTSRQLPDVCCCRYASSMCVHMCVCVCACVHTYTQSHFSLLCYGPKIVRTFYLPQHTHHQRMCTGPIIKTKGLFFATISRAAMSIAIGPQTRHRPRSSCIHNETIYSFSLSLIVPVIQRWGDLLGRCHMSMAADMPHLKGV